MKFALGYNTAALGTDPDAMTAVARRAEELGFESIYLAEHIVFHPGATMHGMAVHPTTAVADPLESLSFIAARTERLLLGTGVLLLPYRHPVVLAKQLATIDLLSKGRLRNVTVGLGVVEREASATGVDFASRGRRADEAIDVLRLLWAGGEDGVSFDGEFFGFDDICVYPKPFGGEILPLHVGGSSRAAARRAGSRGDGYFAGGMLPPQERLDQLQEMRAAAMAAGRDPDHLEYTRWGSLDLDEARVRSYADQGVARLVVNPPLGTVDEQVDGISRFAERVGLEPGRAAPAAS
jgi:probable F420-dependent oxidoreductase